MNDVSTMSENISARPCAPLSIKIIGWCMTVIFTGISAIGAVAFISYICGAHVPLSAKNIQLIACGVFWTMLFLSFGPGMLRGDNSSRIIYTVISVFYVLVFAGFSLSGNGKSEAMGMFCFSLIFALPCVFLYRRSTNSWFRGMKAYRRATHRGLGLSSLGLFILGIVAVPVASGIAYALDAKSRLNVTISADQALADNASVMKAIPAYMAAIVAGQDRNDAIKSFDAVLLKEGSSPDHAICHEFRLFFLEGADTLHELYRAQYDWSQRTSDNMARLGDENSDAFLGNPDGKADSVLRAQEDIDNAMGAVHDSVYNKLKALLDNPTSDRSFLCGENGRVFLESVFRRGREMLKLSQQHRNLLWKLRKVCIDLSKGAISEEEASEKAGNLGRDIDIIEKRMAALGSAPFAEVSCEAPGGTGNPTPKK